MWNNDIVDQSDCCLTVCPVIGCVPYIETGGGTARQDELLDRMTSFCFTGYSYCSRGSLAFVS